METKLKNILQGMQEWAGANRDSKWPLMTSSEIPKSLLRDMSEIPALLERYEYSANNGSKANLFEDYSRRNYRGLPFPALPLVGMNRYELLISHPKDGSLIQMGCVEPSDRWISHAMTGQLYEEERGQRAIRIIGEDDKIDTLWIPQPAFASGRFTITNVFKEVVDRLRYQGLNRAEAENDRKTLESYEISDKVNGLNEGASYRAYIERRNAQKLVEGKTK